MRGVLTDGIVGGEEFEELVEHVDEFDAAGEGVGGALFVLDAPEDGGGADLLGEAGGEGEELEFAEGYEAGLGVGAGGGDEAGGFGRHAHMMEVGCVDGPGAEGLEVGDLAVEGVGGEIGGGAAVLEVEHAGAMFAGGEAGGDEAVEAAGGEDDGGGFGHGGSG
jgi:hypothetical protein